MRLKLFICVFILLSGSLTKARAQSNDSAKSWVFWYWMHGAVSPEGITADLEAMKHAGIGGA